MRLCGYCKKKKSKQEFCTDTCRARHYREIGRYDTESPEIRLKNKFLLAPVRA